MSDFILAFESSGARAGAALLDGGGQLVREIVLGAETRGGQGLAPAARTCLDAAGLAPADLAGVAVDIGPGSYTGLRVGVMTAKAFCFGAGCPLAGVSSLEAIAWRARDRASLLAVTLSARRNEIYHACFERGEAGLLPRVEACALSPEELAAALRALPAGAAVLGNGLAQCGEALRAELAPRLELLPHEDVPLPSAVADLGRLRLLREPEGDALHALQPLYPRRRNVSMPVLGEPVEGDA